jgi:DNA-binding transcriptional ArsR family regulator
LAVIFLFSYASAVTVVFEVLAEPNRRRLLDLLLTTGEQPVGALVATLAISQPAVSKHLRVLREAGLVAVRADGQRRLYSARPEGLREVDEWLHPYRQAWARRLDALGDHLDDLAAARAASDHPPPHPTATEDER